MAQLEYLLELDFTIPEISRLLHVSLSTVMRRMKEYRLSVKKTYTQISAEDLKKVVSEFIQQCPNSGYAMVSGYLKSLGIKVTRSTVRETLKAVDPVGTLLRGLHLNFIHRRVYSVPSPLSLWHIDGNHRLIKWISLTLEWTGMVLFLAWIMVLLKFLRPLLRFSRLYSEKSLKTLIL
uniref:Integrase core domain-containing protein n=1 Tax=Cyprinus carpio carpio TaxID=630221 RepID=A0A9J8A4I4_CYPCA